MAGKFLVGQCPGEAYPDQPEAPGKALQHGGRKRQITGVLRQGKHLRQCFPAAGWAGSGVAPCERGGLPGKGNGQLRRDAEQVEGVLAGVQVGQQKPGLFAGYAQQHGEPVGGFRQLNGDAAFAAGGLPQLGAQLPVRQQHRAAHQRHQHQKRGQQRRPERVPPFASVHKNTPFREKVLERRQKICGRDMENRNFSGPQPGETMRGNT